ncbi:uncharacterized protein LOC110182406 [Drosophila serrata]|uniref:uncharacterized protein LOC110182406 n=1 Tax=Drosophila serrata TaxID=7274 RepID=UPI000A1CF6BF|nr:uncharacterized protein LOC110182406 [Drosophila serrata]
MSRRSPTKQDGNSKSENSTEEEDELAMQAAMREMVKNAEMDEMARRKSHRLKAQPTPKEADTNKNQVEQGLQTTESPKKVKSSKPETTKAKSEDSWASIFFKRLFRFGNQTKRKDGIQQKASSPERDKLSKKDSPKKDVKENRQIFKPQTVNERHSPPRTSKESFMHTERYVSTPNPISMPEIEEIIFQDSELGNEQLSEELVQKLQKIEEASKPKSWVRPKPIVINPKKIASPTKDIENKVKPKPYDTTKEKRGHINILTSSFPGSLNYVTKGKSAESPRENSAEKHKDNIPESTENSFRKYKENTEKPPDTKRSSETQLRKSLDHHDSQRTLTIKGHKHITTRWGDHCHYEDRQDGIDKVAKKNLIIACILCFTFMVAEIVGGVLSKSLAIATDAAHLLTDLAAFLISLFALYLSGRPSSQRLNFGWYRAEVIGAMISVYLIWVVTGILVYMAIQRLINKDHDLDAKIMLITSALAILFNIIMACQLSHGHSHSNLGNPSRTKITESHHGSGSGINSHTGLRSPLGYSVSTQLSVKSERNINVRAALIHVVGDLFQSIGVFVAALIIFFKPEWAFMDSVCTFLFSILVLGVTIKILKDVLMVLMEATPDYMDYDEVKRTFLSIEGVMHVHNLRIWALSINKVALSAHLAIAKDADPQLILERATRLIHKRHKFFETTIQIEEYSSGMLDCGQCADPLSKKDTPNPIEMEEGTAVGILKKAEKKPKAPETD